MHGVYMHIDRGQCAPCSLGSRSYNGGSYGAQAGGATSSRCHPRTTALESSGAASSSDSRKRSRSTKEETGPGPTSGHRGVSWSKGGKWVAQITVDGKKQHLGSFADEVEAAVAYTEAAAAKVRGLPLAPPPRRKTSSAHRGVCWYKARGKWVAQIKIDGKQRNLGRYADEEQAAAAYREAAAAIAQGSALPAPPARAEPSSQHRGVHWNKASGKWEAQICVNGKRRHLGCFADEEQAAAAYREAAVRQINH